MSNLANFKDLLANEAATKGLPNVVLSQTTDLGQAFDQVVTIDNRQDQETDAQVTARYVAEICDDLGKAENAKVVELFDQVSAAFSERIRTAWSTISAINEQANTLAAEMDSRTQAYLGRDEYVKTHQNYSNMSEDFPEFAWGGTTIMGSPEDTIKEVNLLAAGGKENPDAPKACDKRILDIVLSNLDHHIILNKIENVSDDDRKNIVEAAVATCPTIGAATIVDIIDIMLGIKPFQNTYNGLKYINTEKPIEMFRNIQRIDAFITDVFPIADGVASGSIVVPDAIKEQMVANAQMLIRFCRIASYYETMQRNSIFSNALVLQGGMINADKKEAFAAAGGNNAMIATYLRKLYNDDKSMIPVIGIGADTIVKAYGNIVEDVQKDIAEVERRLTVANSVARYAAFKEVAMKYLATKDQTPNRSTFVNERMRNYGLCIADCVKQYNINFSDAARDLIIKTEYAGTFVETVQSRLGTAYLAMLGDAEGEKVNEDKILCADISVITDVVVEFVADKMLTVVKCVEQPAPNAAPIAPLQNPEEIKEAGATPAQEA